MTTLDNTDLDQMIGLVGRTSWNWQSSTEPPPDGTPLEYAAAYYARHGLAIVPLRGKNPSAYGDDWWTRAITDPTEALMVFSNTNFTNIGWAQGYGTVAVDVDKPTGLTDEIRSVIVAGALNNTRPGRGHRIFATAEMIGASTAGFPVEGWGEVRAHGGQVVIWGPHPDDLTCHYRYDPRQAVPPTPPELLEWLRPRSEYEDAATDAEVDAFLAEHTEAAVPSALKLVFRWADEQLDGGLSLHELTAKRIAPWIFREVRAGLYSGKEADQALEKWWKAKWAARADHRADADGQPQRTRPGKKELAGIRSWGVAQAMAEPDDKIATIRSSHTINDLLWVDEVNRSTPTPEIVIPSNIDDAYMAAAFANVLVGRYLYVAAWRRWLRWDGKRWADDDVEAVHESARRWVLALGKHMIDEGADPKDIAKVASYRSKGRLDAVVTMARRMKGIAARADEFDQHDDLLNVDNGVVNLRTGDLEPHDPGLRLRKIANAKFIPGATHKDVDAVVAVVDDDVRPWLRRLFGYAATGHTHEDVVPVFDGAGANGKTTILEAIASSLGDYAGAAPAKLIMRSNNDEHPTIKADLLGQRLVWISETEEGGSLRMEQLKALTGGDRIKARFMRADYFEFQPSHTLVVATNHRPYVNSTEHAAWRRLRLVPFPHTYRSPDEAEPGDRFRDARLRQRLRGGQAQRSAMLAWIVAGAVEWHRDGLGECGTVTRATAQWRQSEDVILRFIGDCLELGATGMCRGRDLYMTYRDWCEHEGRRPKSNKNFIDDFMTHEMVTSAGIEVVRPQNQAHYKGVEIRTTAGF